MLVSHVDVPQSQKNIFRLPKLLPLLFEDRVVVGNPLFEKCFSIQNLFNFKMQSSWWLWDETAFWEFNCIDFIADKNALHFEVDLFCFRNIQIINGTHQALCWQKHRFCLKAKILRWNHMLWNAVKVSFCMDKNLEDWKTRYVWEQNPSNICKYTSLSNR